MAVHVTGDPASFAPRLRALATAVGEVLSAYGVALIVLYTMLMMVVCMLACIVPAGVRSGLSRLRR